METESNTRVTVHSDAGARMEVSLAQLQTIVQDAYDRHGILASPSYALEAERATERKPGACPCGTEGCSDRPAYVAEYRRGLQGGAL